jgi:hypothetical protein
LADGVEPRTAAGLRDPPQTIAVAPAPVTRLDVDVAAASFALDLPAGEWVVHPFPAGADRQPRVLVLRAMRG